MDQFTHEAQSPVAASISSVGKFILFWGGIVFTMVVPLYSTIELSNSTAAWISFLIGVFVTLMSKLEDIAELSLGPLRTRMREKIEEADTTLERLREIALSLAAVSLADLIADNFIAGMPLKAKLDFHDGLMESLRQLDIKESDLIRAEKQWRLGIGIIYTRAIRHAAAERDEKSNLGKREKEDAEFREAISDLGKLFDIKENWEAPSPAEYEKFLTDRRIINDAARAWIDDYRHFLETGEIRRRDLFAQQ